MGVFGVGVGRGFTSMLTLGKLFMKANYQTLSGVTLLARISKGLLLFTVLLHTNAIWWVYLPGQAHLGHCHSSNVIHFIEILVESQTQFVTYYNS